MNTQLALSVNTPIVTIQNDKPVTTSHAVACFFEKRHERVLDRIKNLDCSSEFTKHNFVFCFKNNELQNGKPQPYYQMTKDGFVFLVMGFTGKEALTYFYLMQ